VILKLVAAAAVLALVGFVGQYLLGVDGPEARSATMVPANQQWTDSGTDLRPGQQVRLLASGEIYSAPGVRNDPDGALDQDQALSLLPATGHAALIAKIGDEGVPFPVGERASVRAPRGGRLYLGVNDLAFRDNSGYYQVEIVVSG
jgi:hypothetical protein